MSNFLGKSEVRPVGMESVSEEIARLREQNARLSAKLAKRNGVGPLRVKVSQKGAVSVYGLQRWPVTLYASQWERLLADAESIGRFIRDNRESLSVKSEE